MSTRTLLDPNVRKARYRRAEAIKVLRNAAPIVTTPAGAAMMAKAARLELFRRSPRHSGAVKDLLFRAVLRGVQVSLS